ncbi:MAG: hypothetical protein JKP96_14675 [Oceanicaulis sp.]|jgi:hypothetical protein|nr:hypothetical protein [Oceanicaulis sp.]
MTKQPFSSVQDWLDHAKLPDTLAANPKLTKPVILEIAEKNGIEAPDHIHVLWQHLTHVSHDYERSKTVSFNTFPKAMREHIEKLRGKISETLAFLDESAFPDELAWLEQRSFVTLLHEAELAGEASEQPILFEEQLTPAKLRAQLMKFDAFFADSVEHVEPVRRGHPGNFALKVFVRQMLEYWTRTLGRDVRVDHKHKHAYSDAPYFLASCVHPLDEIEDRAINSAARAWLTGKK